MSCYLTKGIEENNSLISLFYSFICISFYGTKRIYFGRYSVIVSAPKCRGCLPEEFLNRELLLQIVLEPATYISEDSFQSCTVFSKRISE